MKRNTNDTEKTEIEIAEPLYPKSPMQEFLEALRAARKALDARVAAEVDNAAKLRPNLTELEVRQLKLLARARTVDTVRSLYKEQAKKDGERLRLEIGRAMGDALPDGVFSHPKGPSRVPFGTFSELWIVPWLSCDEQYVTISPSEHVEDN